MNWRAVRLLAGARGLRGGRLYHAIAEALYRRRLRFARIGRAVLLVPGGAR